MTVVFASILPCLFPGAASAEVIATDAWISAAPPVVRVNAGYLNLQNHSDHSLNLVGAESPRFARIEIHRSEMHNGINSMRREASLALGPGAVLSFAPGELHLMLFEPDPAPQPGEVIPLTLIFADGLRVPVDAEVRAAQPGAGHHNH